MSFFELYKLAKHNKLKFSRLALMDDTNEGFAMVLSRKKGNNLKLHKVLKNSHFISCWTQEKDSMAMWLLYSRNRDAIRVKTTDKKLKKHADKYCVSHYHKDTKSLEVGTIFSPSFSSKTNFVNYRSYSDVAAQVQRDGWKSVILDSCMIKDEVYKFENEVRSCIHLQKRNDISSQEIDVYHKRNTIAKILNDGTAEELDDCNDSVIYIDVESDFIEEICFDPRMQEYQVDIYKEILGIPKSKIKSTNIFSSKMDEK